MLGRKNPIWEVLKSDQEMIEETKSFLAQKGLLGLLERIPGLLDSVAREADAAMPRSRPDPFVKSGADGKAIGPSEHLFRLWMLHGSAPIS